MLKKLIFCALLLNLWIATPCVAAVTDYPVIIGTQGFTVPGKGYIYIGMSKEYANSILGSGTVDTDYVFYDNLSLHYSNNIVVGIYCTIPGVSYSGYVITENKTVEIPESNIQSITIDTFKAGTYVVIDPATGITYMHTPNSMDLNPLYKTNYTTSNAIKLGI